MKKQTNFGYPEREHIFSILIEPFFPFLGYCVLSIYMDNMKRKCQYISHEFIKTIANFPPCVGFEHKSYFFSGLHQILVNYLRILDMFGQEMFDSSSLIIINIPACCIDV